MIDTSELYAILPTDDLKYDDEEINWNTLEDVGNSVFSFKNMYGKGAISTTLQDLRFGYDLSIGKLMKL